MKKYNNIKDLKITLVLNILKKQALELRTKLVNVDFELIKLAINAYTLRNKVYCLKKQMDY